MFVRDRVAIDKLGICTSTLCIVHCLAVPVFLILGLDTLYWWVNSESLELALIGLSIVIGLISFFGGYLRHKQHFVPVLFVAGFLLMINGESVEREWLGVVLSTLGASIVIYAHFNNHRLRRRVT